MKSYIPSFLFGVVMLVLSSCQTTSFLSTTTPNVPTKNTETTVMGKQTSVTTTQKQTIVTQTQPEPINEYSFYYQEATAKYSNPNRSETFIFPNVADLEVTPTKITYSQTFSTKKQMTASQYKKSVEEFNRQLNTGVEPAFVKQWKSLVIANAAVKYQADEIVAPIFIITPNANKTEVEVKVTGYVGKYKNFRKATEKDINFLNTYNGAQ